MSYSTPVWLFNAGEPAESEDEIMLNIIKRVDNCNGLVAKEYITHAFRAVIKNRIVTLYVAPKNKCYLDYPRFSLANLLRQVRSLMYSKQN